MRSHFNLVCLDHLHFQHISDTSMCRTTSSKNSSEQQAITFTTTAAKAPKKQRKKQKSVQTEPAQPDKIDQYRALEKDCQIMDLRQVTQLSDKLSNFPRQENPDYGHLKTDYRCQSQFNSSSLGEKCTSTHTHTHTQAGITLQFTDSRSVH